MRYTVVQMTFFWHICNALLAYTKNEIRSNPEILALFIEENECPPMWTVGTPVTQGETVRSSLWAHLPQCRGRLCSSCTACMFFFFIVAFCSVVRSVGRFSQVCGSHNRTSLHHECPRLDWRVRWSWRLCLQHLLLLAGLSSNLMRFAACSEPVASLIPLWLDTVANCLQRLDPAGGKLLSCTIFSSSGHSCWMQAAGLPCLHHPYFGCWLSQG